VRFQQILTDLLVEKHHTQAELARFVGVKPNTVSDWIKKGTSPKIEHIYMIAQFFCVSFDYLFMGQDNNQSNISQSNVGAIGNHSNGTVNINHSDDDEISKEVADIIKSLPLKERSILLTLIYEFEEKCRP